MSLSHSPQIVTNGLVLYLDAANTKSYPGSGTVWTDLSGNKRDGTKNGSQSPTYPLWNNTGYFSFTGGATGDNYSRFDVSSIPSFNALSVFSWYRSFGAVDRSLLRMDNSDFGIRIDGNTAVGVFAGTNYNDIGIWSPPITPGNGQWHSVGLTFNGSLITLYYDGVPLSTGTRETPVATQAGTLRIGTRDDAFAQHFVGDIAQVSIYNRALTAAEISQNFNALRGRFGI